MSLFAIIFVLNAAALRLVLSSQPCPTWFILDSNQCVCGITFPANILECSPLLNTTTIQTGYCLTLDDATNEEVFGECPYNSISQFLTFSALPSDVLQLDEVMCGPLNRTGTMCSECQPGLGQALFSKFRECKKCLNSWLGWTVMLLRFVLLSTFFCVIIIIIQINIGSPALNLFVLAAQIIDNLLTNNPFIIDGHLLSRGYTIQKFVADIYGLFSLDFFNFAIPSFCIQNLEKETVNMLSQVVFNYIVALYPMIFTVLVYICITLHDNGYRVVVICWRPFRKCLMKCRRRWNLKGSVINAFATFLILSYNRVCATSLHLMQPVKVWDKYGNWSWRMYFNPQVSVDSPEYIVSASVASTIIMVVVFMPALLILVHQNKAFKKCTCCRIKSVLFHEMAKLLQSGFKDGSTQGTRDYRWFAGFYLLLRVPLVFLLSQEHHLVWYATIFSVLSLLVATLRPYKVNRYNVVDSMMWWISTIAVTWYNYFKVKGVHWGGFYIVCLSFPIACILCNICLTGASFIIKWKRSQNAERAVLLSSINTEDGALPDRLLNPRRYKF